SQAHPLTRFGPAWPWSGEVGETYLVVAGECDVVAGSRLRVRRRCWFRGAETSNDATIDRGTPQQRHNRGRQDRPVLLLRGRPLAGLLRRRALRPPLTDEVAGPLQGDGQRVVRHPQRGIGLAVGDVGTEPALLEFDLLAGDRIRADLL